MIESHGYRIDPENATFEPVEEPPHICALPRPDQFVGKRVECTVCCTRWRGVVVQGLPRSPEPGVRLGAVRLT